MRHSSRVPNGCNGLLIPLSSANYADAFSLSSFYIFITEINPAHPQDVVSIDKTSTCRGHWWTPLAVLPVNDSEITNWPTSAAGELGARYLQEKPPDRKLEEVRTIQLHVRISLMIWMIPSNQLEVQVVWPGPLLSSWGRTFVTPILDGSLGCQWIWPTLLNEPPQDDAARDRRQLGRSLRVQWVLLNSKTS